MGIKIVKLSKKKDIMTRLEWSKVIFENSMNSYKFFVGQSITLFLGLIGIYLTTMQIVKNNVFELSLIFFSLFILIGIWYVYNHARIKRVLASSANDVDRIYLCLLGLKKTYEFSFDTNLLDGNIVYPNSKPKKKKPRSSKLKRTKK